MPTLRELSERYLYHLRVERNLSANTLESYGRDIRALCQGLQGAPADVADIAPRHLTDYLAGMAQAGAAAASQRRAISAIRQLFLFAQRERFVLQSPARDLEAPQVARTLPKVPTAAQAAALLDALSRDQTPRGLRDSVALELLYGAGLRASELCQLTVDDIDLALGLIRLRGKGNKERLVPMGEPALQALVHYFQRGRTQMLQGRAHSLLMVSNSGRPLSRVGLFALVKRRALAAGLDKDVSPHTLRHAFATHLLHGGADLRAVQEMLGHASIATTEIYTHVGPQILQKTIDLHHPLAQTAPQLVAEESSSA